MTDKNDDSEHRQEEANRDKYVGVRDSKLRHRIKAVADLYKTRKSAAEAAGVSVDQLGKYINGSTPTVPIQAILGLCWPQNVRIEWIAAGTGPMHGAAPGVAEEPASYEGRLQRLSAANAAVLEAERMLHTRLDAELLGDVQGLVFAWNLEAKDAYRLLALLKKAYDAGREGVFETNGAS